MIGTSYKLNEESSYLFGHEFIVFIVIGQLAADSLHKSWPTEVSEVSSTPST